MLNECKHIFIILACCVLTATVFAQTGLENELRRFQVALERVESLVLLLQDRGNSDVKSQVVRLLNDARDNFRQAREYLQNNQPARARLAIREGVALLRQIEQLIKENPVLKFRFQEQLDRKIQEAEELLQSQHNAEAWNMLNRAKFFRQRAFMLFREGETIAALEYYRLSLNLADDVVRLFRRSGRDDTQEQIRQAYLDTELLFERVRAQLADQQNDRQYYRLLNTAETEFQSVRKLYEQRNYGAVRQRLTAINLALFRILDAIERMPASAADQLNLDLDALRYSHSQLAEMLRQQNLPAAQSLYQRSQSLMERAENLLRKGETEKARRNIFYANQIVVRLYRLLEQQREAQPEQLNQQISRTREYLLSMRSQQTEWDKSGAFLQMTESNLDAAEKAYAAGNYPQAASYLKIANKLVVQFNQLQLQQTSRDIAETAVREELTRFEQLLQRLQQRSTAESDFAIVYETAAKLHEMAAKALQEKRLLLSRELTRLGMRMLTED